MTQYQCAAALFRANACPTAQCCCAEQVDSRFLSLLLQQPMLIQVCCDPVQMQCSTVEGKMHASLLSAAVQKSLTAAWCQLRACIIANDAMQCATPMHCSIAYNNMLALLLSAVVNSRPAAMLRLSSYMRANAVHTVCQGPRPAHCSTAQGKMHSPLLSAAVQIRLTAVLNLSN